MAEEKTVVVQTGYGFGALALAFLTGAAVGAAIALLNTKETGEQLRDRLEGQKDKLSGASSSLLVAAAEAGAAAKTAFQGAIQEARTKADNNKG